MAVHINVMLCYVDPYEKVLFVDIYVYVLDLPGIILYGKTGPLS